MAKNNDLSRLISQSAKGSQSLPAFSGNRRAFRPQDLRSQSITSAGEHRGGIAFGLPSHNSTTASNSGSQPGLSSLDKLPPKAYRALLAAVSADPWPQLAVSAELSPAWPAYSAPIRRHHPLSPCSAFRMQRMKRFTPRPTRLTSYRKLAFTTRRM